MLLNCYTIAVLALHTRVRCSRCHFRRGCKKCCAIRSGSQNILWLLLIMCSTQEKKRGRVRGGLGVVTGQASGGQIRSLISEPLTTALYCTVACSPCFGWRHAQHRLVPGGHRKWVTTLL
ncbi:hypothetical protein BCV70DRAFT_13667 [Testicularia cyperi]|uniref:Uncharacterized protein n=1 Tax=Testicularia cyperi TaxID=1882483 RepID=A0A317XY39_9BASI|nr:hypothetical protein BCV70DRAFT_13667 [Testicularia cyperi]